MYYVFKKSTGEFAGSGLMEISNADYGSTLIEPPQGSNGVAFWTGQAWKINNPNPGVVSPRQLRLAMIEAGIDLAAIDHIIAGNRTAEIEWEYATEINRSHVLLNQLADMMGLTTEQVDAVFAAARKI